MYTKEVCSRIEEMLENEEIVKRLAEASSNAEFKAVFQEAGVQLEDSEVNTIMEQLKAYKTGDTLTEEQLEAVSGGCFLCACAIVVSCAVTAYVVYKVGKWIVDTACG